MEISLEMAGASRAEVSPLRLSIHAVSILMINDEK